MRLILLHPEAAARSCDDCERWMHDDAPGRMGLPVLDNATGKPYPRRPGTSTPCRWCPKIPSDAAKVRTNSIELDERNVRAVIHYRECRAVGAFPDDWIVRRNAAAIRGVEDAAERQRDAANLMQLATLMRAGR